MHHGINKGGTELMTSMCASIRHSRGRIVKLRCYVKPRMDAINDHDEGILCLWKRTRDASIGLSPSCLHTAAQWNYMLGLYLGVDDFCELLIFHAGVRVQKLHDPRTPRKEKVASAITPLSMVVRLLRIWLRTKTNPEQSGLGRLVAAVLQE